MTKHLTLAVALMVATPALALDKAALPAPITDADYLPVNPAEAKLGQLLFWDPILSGNGNISCGAWDRISKRVAAIRA